MNPRRAVLAALPIVLVGLGLVGQEAVAASAGESHDVNASAFECISAPAVQATSLCPQGAPGIVSASWYGATSAVGASSNGTVYAGYASWVYGVNQPLHAPIVGMALDYGDPDTGYPPTWLVGSDGSVFGLAGASDFGSMGGRALNAPMVGMAESFSGRGIPGGFGKGYWLVAADGGVFAFGAAGFYGSMGGHFLAAPIVGIVGTDSGNGYWLVAADGGVFAFGDATFHGSLGGMGLNAPIVAIASTYGGLGYLLFGRDGGVFSFGNAPFVGSFLGAPAIVSGFFASTGGPTPPGPPELYCVAASNGQLYCHQYGP
jgi:hypothetical protein